MITSIFDSLDQDAGAKYETVRTSFDNHVRSIVDLISIFYLCRTQPEHSYRSGFIDRGRAFLSLCQNTLERGKRNPVSGEYPARVNPDIGGRRIEFTGNCLFSFRQHAGRFYGNRSVSRHGAVCCRIGAYRLCHGVDAVEFTAGGKGSG